MCTACDLTLCPIESERDSGRDDPGFLHRLLPAAGQVAFDSWQLAGKWTRNGLFCFVPVVVLLGSVQSIDACSSYRW